MVVQVENMSGVILSLPQISLKHTARERAWIVLSWAVR